MTIKMQPIIVPATMDGVKLDKFLIRNFPALPKQMFHKVCRTGELRVNSKRVKGDERLKSGDIVRVPPTLANLKAKDDLPKTNDGSKFSMSDLEVVRKTIIYNDDDLVVFDKPAGLAAQGGTGIAKSLDKMAAALFPDSSVLPVHRLDRETSGLIVFAKNLAAARNLSEQFQNKSAAKEYIAVLAGDVKKNKGLLETFMAKRNETENAKRALTEFEVLGNIPGKMTLIKFNPRTGRTHQLRIHAAKELRAPIFGDDIYGYKKDAEKYEFGQVKNLHLLARKLSFVHPATGQVVQFTASVPGFMKKSAKALGYES